MSLADYCGCSELSNTATRRSARRSQTVDSLRRALAAVAESFPGSRGTPASGRAEKSRGALERRLARAPPLRRRGDPKTVLRSSSWPMRRRYAVAATLKARRRPWATSGPRRSAASCRPARGRGPRTPPSRRPANDPYRIDLEPSRQGRRRHRDRRRPRHHPIEEHRWT